MSGAIRGARILTPDECIDTGPVVFDDEGRITSAGPATEVPPGAEITEASGLTLAPGFIDLHVHGGGGFSLATKDSSEIESYARWVTSRGVTGFLATIFASDFDQALAFVGAAGYVSDWQHVTLELIADGVHLHPATVRAIVRAAGSDRIALVSDAVPPAGSDGGAFRVGDQDATLTGDRVLLPDGAIAGGAATMGGIVRNVVEWGAGSLAEAVRMASTVPARVLGLSDRKGRLAPGFDADLVALDNNLNVAMTWAG